MSSMFSSFTSILSPAIKEKLGIGPKPSAPVAPPSGSPKLSPSRNRSRIRQLPTTLVTEVQSPGFSSRLTKLVRKQEEAQMENLSLSSSSSPHRFMSRAGRLPVVNLSKRQPPKLTNRNSEMFGRGSSRSPRVTLRIAPSEPYSPFKRYSGGGSADRVRGGVGDRNDQKEGSTDPRQVIAVLAELSGKRTRRPSDENSVNGSKRARRDSSSSLGSSLSMEMPPLFSNGVVGQTTSHLVSREADLSLGSLLSRNQTLFGGHHGAGPLAMVGMSPPVPTANAQSQTNGGLGSQSGNSNKSDRETDKEKSKAIAAEIEASLSSSRCMLKRGRKELENSDESDGDEDMTLPSAKKSNVFRSPDKHLDGKKVSVSQTQSTRASIESSASVDKTSDTGVIVPSPEDVLGTIRRKIRTTSQVIGEKEIRGEKELQRKRLEKMLDIFPDQREKTKNARVKENTTPGGGFPFQLGEKFETQKSTVESSKGGFPFDLGTKSSAESVTTSSIAPPSEIVSTTIEIVKSVTNTLTTSTSFSLGNISTVVGGSPPDILGGVVDKKQTAVTFNLGANDDIEKVKDPKTTDVTPVVKLKEDNKSTSGFSFGTTNLTNIKEKSNSVTPVTGSKQSSAENSTDSSIKLGSTFSFEAATVASSVAAQSNPLTIASSSSTLTFGKSSHATTLGQTSVSNSSSFGKVDIVPSKNSSSDPKEATTLASGTATFSFGQSTAVTSSNSTTFSFGQTATASAASTTSAASFGQATTVTTTENSGASFSFGQTVPTTKSGSPFTFGQSSTAASTTTTTASDSKPFTFGQGVSSVAAATTTASSFSFGGQTVKPITTTAAGSPFTFGANIESSAASQSGNLFQFGTGQFGKDSAAAPITASTTSASFSFGQTATTTAAATVATPAFQFGATATTAPATTAPATTTSQSSFTFGKANEPAKPSFTFGGSNTPAASPFGATPAKAPAPTFGASAAQAPSFGATQAKAPAPSFGAPSTNAPSLFGVSTAQTPAPAFGAPSAQAPASTFGAPSTQAPAFGAPSTNTFGASTASSGVFSFGKTDPAKDPPAANASPFTFGAAPAGGTPAKSSPFAFGGQGAAVSKSSTFTFGGAAPAPAVTTAAGGVFTFGGGAPSQTAAPSTFGGGAPQPVAPAFGAPQPVAPTFGGGAPSQPAAAPAQSSGFNFAAAAQSPPSGGVFSFGGAAAANQAPAPSSFGAPAPSFGAPAPSFGAPAPSFGAQAPAFGAPAPAFGATSPPAPAGGGNMFSIGAGGGNQNRASTTSRRIATARRTRK